MPMKKVSSTPAGSKMYTVDYEIRGVHCPFGVDRGRKKNQYEIVIRPLLDDEIKYNQSIKNRINNLTKNSLCLCNFCQDKHCVLIVDGGDIGVVGFEIEGTGGKPHPFLFSPYAEQTMSDIYCSKCKSPIPLDYTQDSLTCPGCGDIKLKERIEKC